MLWQPTNPEVQYWVDFKALEFAREESKGSWWNPTEWLGQYIYLDIHDILFFEFPIVLHEWLSKYAWGPVPVGGASWNAVLEVGKIIQTLVLIILRINKMTYICFIWKGISRSIKASEPTSDFGVSFENWWCWWNFPSSSSYRCEIVTISDRRKNQRSNNISYKEFWKNEGKQQ